LTVFRLSVFLSLCDELRVKTKIWWWCWTG